MGSQNKIKDPARDPRSLCKWATKYPGPYRQPALLNGKL